MNQIRPVAYYTLRGFKLFDWHLGWTLYRIGFTSIISLDNYGWWVECEFPFHSCCVTRLTMLVVTPAFFGAGMLSGLNASWSFCKWSVWLFLED